ncbi:hypothetical protein CONLIGDRAFT_687772 [Coniochaeta ligniaria NRRL 30616]|uniref:Uncharacterized protein n=1 Tax=Coniochaeta ligniaria NRRL 30616 TaxID=1408157 RepID=A0A1J7I3U2_9PEZI|nr:hypothetical protein CONLIGDRAFT_687772 [Coniochaeta ligniaria NRRL 30616]
MLSVNKRISQIDEIDSATLRYKVTVVLTPPKVPDSSVPAETIVKSHTTPAREFGCETNTIMIGLSGYYSDQYLQTPRMTPKGAHAVDTGEACHPGDTNAEPSMPKFDSMRHQPPPHIRPNVAVPHVWPSGETPDSASSQSKTDSESEAKPGAKLTDEDQGTESLIFRLSPPVHQPWSGLQKNPLTLITSTPATAAPQKRKFSDDHSEYESTPEYKQPWLTEQRKRAKTREQQRPGAWAVTEGLRDTSAMTTRELMALLPKRLDRLGRRAPELNRRGGEVERQEEMQRKAEVGRGEMGAGDCARVVIDLTGMD